jgi:hypothetical protein
VSKKKRLAKVAIKVQYATALNRRNLSGDRDKALSILLNEVTIRRKGKNGMRLQHPFS